MDIEKEIKELKRIVSIHEPFFTHQYQYDQGLLMKRFEKIEAQVKKKRTIEKKNNVIAKLCTELDHLYFYAKKLIPKNITHDLGHKKELLKGIIEELILVI
ncbi:hypothetical protein LCGC14_0804740 [marine sediment metagenome]|uniref:Uncharacterized protein n=1 Tax=marine sediment metagenome TaxID=412755 RepID=A0A0F9S8M9_9ZZZZ